MQEKILRVIEYKEFQRVGGTNTLTTDVRIVGATNENLHSKNSAYRSG
jgi:psp operon transcriptional activator